MCSQVGELRDIRARATANGVTDLVLLSREEAVALEPALQCQAALLSPSTGILDSHRCVGVWRRVAFLGVRCGCTYYGCCYRHSLLHK